MRPKGRYILKKKILIFFIVLIILLAYAVHWAFFDMSISRLPKGEFISAVESPNGKYTIKAYLTNGGATTSYGIRGELNFNNSIKNPKNIYWDYKIEEAIIEWIDDDVVIINGIELKVPYEKFDWRRKL